MRDFIRDRWEEDLRTMQSPSGNVDISCLVASWCEDAAWITNVRSLSPNERRRRLAELGAKTFECDLGRFATELRWNTRTLNDLWSSKERDQVLEKHVELLFASASDTIDFLVPAEIQWTKQQVEVSGFEHVEESVALGKGIVLLGAYQCHPGFLFYHPLLADLKIAAVQHVENATGETAKALTEDRRVLLLPDTRASVRTMLELLKQGQCIMLYNDFVYPAVTPIKSPLFGRMVLISRALLSIAVKTGASVVPFAIARQWPLDRDEVRLDFFPRLPLAGFDYTCEEHLQTAALVFGLATECLIRRYPAQWRLWNSLELRWQQAETV